MSCCITISFINAVIHINIVMLTCFWDVALLSLKTRYDSSSVKDGGRKKFYPFSKDDI